MEENPYQPPADLRPPKPPRNWYLPSMFDVALAVLFLLVGYLTRHSMPKNRPGAYLYLVILIGSFLFIRHAYEKYVRKSEW